MSRMNRIYIGRLPYQAREKDVERFFRGFGRIKDINLKNGFGFVEFDDSRDAEDAVYELHGRELLGERVIVEHARGNNRDRDGGGGGGRDYRGGDRGSGGRDYRGHSDRGRNNKYGPPLRTDYRILVENISSRVSWQDLKDFMRSAGEITYADAHKQRQGEGIVEYATYDDMKNALKKLDGAELNGRRVRLIEDYRGGSRKKSRSRSRSRSRSHRSRSRSRSRSHSKERSRSRSHSKERSGDEKERSPDRSRDEDVGRRSRSGSRDKDDDNQRSRSGSPIKNNNDSRDDDQGQEHDRSRSRSRSRSHSASPRQERESKEEEMGSRSPSPPQIEANDNDE